MKSFLLSVLFVSNCLAKDFLPDTFRAKFTQSYKSSLSGKPKKNNGLLEYQFPSQIRFITEGYEKVTFVTNGDKSWYYTAPFVEGEPGELTVRRLGKKGLPGFFDTIKKGGLKSNKDFTVKSIRKGKFLKFKKKKADEMGIRSATFFFEKSNKFSDVDKISITYTDGKSTTLKLTQVQKIKKFKAKYFYFVPPKNTRIK